MKTFAVTTRRLVSRSARILTTGSSFAVFGIGGLILSLAVFPVLRRLPGGSDLYHARAQRLVHLSFRLFVRFMSALQVLELSVEGGERLEGPHAQLLVANHPTLLDVVMLVSLMPQLDCVVKREAWSNPFLRGVVEATDHIPNDPGEALVSTCSERLRRGRSVLLFPEGTRSPERGLGPFRRGAAHVALFGGWPIRPVVITCDPPSLMRGQKWYEVPERKMQFRVEVGDSLDPACVSRKPRARGASARNITAALREHFEKRIGTSPSEANAGLPRT